MILFGGYLFATYKSRSFRANVEAEPWGGTIPAMARRIVEVLPAWPGARSVLTLPDGPIRVEFTINIQRQDGIVAAGGDESGASDQRGNSGNSTITGVFDINGAVSS